MAFVVLRPGATVTPADLIEWSRDQMANYKAPRTFTILDELPLNATGKVEKLVLRDRALAGSAGSPASGSPASGSPASGSSASGSPS